MKWFKTRLAVTVLAALTACSTPTVQVRIVRGDGVVSEYKVRLKRSESHFEYRMSAASLTGIDTLSLTPDFARAVEGDEGFFMNSQGYMTYFLPERRDTSVWIYARHPIALQGIKTPGGCYAAFFHTYRWNMRSRTDVHSGEYVNSFDFILKDVPITSDLVVEYWPLRGSEASYSGMGRLYRRLFVENNPEMVPLRERVKSRPYLRYAVEHPEIRIRQAWKPVPTPVPDQTRENEPAVRVKVPFDRVCDIADALKAGGVDSAQFTLVGWNLKGHDGRYPTVFPPEPTLGGEERLRHLISYVQEKGFQIVPHICTGDAYKVSEDWDPADIAKLPSGELDSSYVYSSGRMYKICPEVSYRKYVQKINDSLRAYGFRGVEYNDVYSIVAPVTCCDPAHPLDFDAAARYDRLILKDGADKLGGIGSEGGYDHVAPVLDFCLYATTGGSRNLSFLKLRDKYVPVWHIIYNGYIYSCPSSYTVNYTTKEPLLAMKMQEYGGHPTFYFYAAHRDDAKNWIGNHQTDLYCGTQEELEQSVKAIRRGYDYLREYGYIQYLRFDDHCEVADSVFRSRFSDGTRTYCNYSSGPVSVDGIIVGAKDWVIVKGVL